MKSVAEFFHMGGYAWYVWGSYGVTFALMAAETVALLRGRRRVVRRLARMNRLKRGGTGDEGEA